MEPDLRRARQAPGRPTPAAGGFVFRALNRGGLGALLNDQKAEP
jgi:hypothetical protein